MNGGIIKLQRFTFGMIKPDITNRNAKEFSKAMTVLDTMLQDQNLLILRAEVGPDGRGITPGKAFFMRFYEEHCRKFFYPRLLIHITSGPVIPMIIASNPSITSSSEDSSNNNPVAKWRDLMGPTHIQTSRVQNPHSFRGRFAQSDTLNALHGSDTVENAIKETGLFWNFPSIVQNDIVQTFIPTMSSTGIKLAKD